MCWIGPGNTYPSSNPPRSGRCGMSCPTRKSVNSSAGPSSSATRSTFSPPTAWGAPQRSPSSERSRCGQPSCARARALRQGPQGPLHPLPLMTLKALRRYWATHHHPDLTFPGGKPPFGPLAAGCSPRVMDRGGVQKAIKLVARDCGIRKNVHIHSLRHSFVTHLLEDGVNLRAIARHPNPARPCQSCDHGALYPHDRRDPAKKRPHDQCAGGAPAH